MKRQSKRSQHIQKKIVARIEEGAWHGHTTETLWAERIDDNRYRLRSVPFFVCALSVEDIVTTRREDDVDVITGVSLYGGHSTYRIFLSEGILPESNSFRKHWQPLADLGCTYERGTERLFAVDIPPAADLHVAYDLFAKGETAGVWDFEEGSVSPAAGIINPNA